MLGVEMSSTGEVGCFGDDQHEALLHALVATGFRFPKRGVLLSLGPLQDKYWFAEEARVIAEELKLPIYATPGTAEALHGLGIPATRLEKHDGPDSGMRAIEEGKIDLVINVPVEYDELGRPDGYMIRRGAVDAGIALITDLQLARAVVEALRHRTMSDLKYALLRRIPCAHAQRHLTLLREERRRSATERYSGLSGNGSGSTTHARIQFSIS